MRVDRRTFCVGVVTAALTTGQACSTPPDEDARSGLVRLLGLQTPNERRWLDVLTEPEQRELHAALLAPDQRPSRRTVDLVLKVMSRRERLFAYVGYPELQRVGICDGLIRE